MAWGVGNVRIDMNLILEAVNDRWNQDLLERIPCRTIHTPTLHTSTSECEVPVHTDSLAVGEPFFPRLQSQTPRQVVT